MAELPISPLTEGKTSRRIGGGGDQGIVVFEGVPYGQPAEWLPLR
jgi:hypothetical protein